MSSLVSQLHFKLPNLERSLLGPNNGYLGSAARLERRRGLRASLTCLHCFPKSLHSLGKMSKLVLKVKENEWQITSFSTKLNKIFQTALKICIFLN